MSVELSPVQRRALKQQAHHLNPVVSTGNAGLTPAVLAEMDSSLAHHELMKIRVLAEDRAARAAMVAEICQRLEAALVQQVGFVATLYRENPEKRKLEKRKAEHRKRQEIRAKAAEGARRDAERKRRASAFAWKPRDTRGDSFRAGTGRSRPNFRRTSPR